MANVPSDNAPPAAVSAAYEELINLVKEANLLASTAALLSWDQETMMPPRGLEYRSRQLAQLAGMTHRMITSPRIGELLAICEDDSAIEAHPTGAPAVNVREIRREHDRAAKLPASLVEEIARTTTLARGQWSEARRESEFARFRPWLQKIVALKQQAAECYGWDEDGEPWDALADDYEPGCTAKAVQSVFTPLRQSLVTLVEKLMGSPRSPSDRFHRIRLPVDQQEQFVRSLAEQIGFDFSRGRLDTSTHPFCEATHCHDVRMTTRFHEEQISAALGSSMHESGHGIYEQGLPPEHGDTPMGQAVGLAIHESQSRLWENQVGRSRAFWTWCYPKFVEFFSSRAGRLSFDDVYSGVNVVKPDFIRVDADEATYSLHVMARFDLERDMMTGNLAVDDLPGAWNEKYKAYLGIDVPDDRRGCLQDIHWSMGAIGYFPTYTLGNLYAAQFFDAALAAIPDLLKQFEQGRFEALKSWLTERIYQHGKRYRSAELCGQVTGNPLGSEPLMRHLEDKLLPLYGL